MSYTLWSHGRLLGETDLGFIYREDGFRCGWLHLNPLGDRLMPGATGVAPAMRAMRDTEDDATAQADVAAAMDCEAALELELRGPNGSVIATESVYIVDTHYLLSIADHDMELELLLQPLTEQQQAEVDELVDEWLAHAEPEEPWRQPEEFPQYQIQIHLVDHDAIP